uniref:Uncharacterized protein n=1 Tax=Scylla olivacea TaxID=85551 RepID=A0A0P4WM22_SCYOL
MVFHADDSYTILPSHFKPRRIQPGKRTILVSVLLSVMLLMSQLFRALQLNHPPQLLNAHSMESLTSLNEEAEVQPCVKTNLGASTHEADSQHSCHHLAPPRGLCSLMQNLFFNSKPQTCLHQTRVTFCATVSGHISCESPALCASLLHYVGVFDEIEARTKWKQINPIHLKKNIEKEVTKKSYFGFLFIKCTNESMDEREQPNYSEDYVHENVESYTQLFLYPKKNTFRMKVTDTVVYPNINLVMVDSLSRPHFYRSLPKTIKFFEDMYGRTHREVFDFQFLQAVKPRTYESLEALFSGHVNRTEIPFGTYDIPKRPLPVSDLLKHYKEKGFRTLWLEDLCWNWEWGLVKDLKVINDSDSYPSWEVFKSALRKANIDSIDMTLASCDILEVNGKKDPFHNLPAVCFNGRYHHEYLLEYLQLYQKDAQNTNQPFVTFTVTDVAHDETGTRVQTLDDSLVKYLSFATNLKNTITILFSDHGSTYGKFIQSSPEAHVETFNPFLFLIMPKNIQDNYGAGLMKILKNNERNLISLIDVHNMLLHLIGVEGKILDRDFAQKYSVPGGLLSSISPHRTCEDIPLLQPNLCICKNFETAVEPTQFHMALADFGIGVLNNMILQQHKKNRAVGFGNCKPLKAYEVRKVLEVRLSVYLIRYKIDVLVNGFKEMREDKEIFFLTIESDSNRNSLRLVSFERISLYGIYSRCRDQNVELKLCVCNTKTQGQNGGFLGSVIFGNLLENFSFIGSKKSNSPSLNELLSQPVFGLTPKIDVSYPETNPCLFTFIHSYKSGLVLYAVNHCIIHHNLKLIIEAENLNLSCENSPQYSLQPSDIRMLVAATVANPKVTWHWNHRVRIQDFS